MALGIPDFHPRAPSRGALLVTLVISVLLLVSGACRSRRTDNVAVPEVEPPAVTPSPSAVAYENAPLEPTMYAVTSVPEVEPMPVITQPRPSRSPVPLSGLDSQSSQSPS